MRDEWVGSGHEIQYYKGSRVLFLTPSGTKKPVFLIYTINIYVYTTDPGVLNILRTTGTGILI